MTVHDVRLGAASAAGFKRRVSRPLDQAEILHLARRLVVFTPAGGQISDLMKKARQAIPMLTPADVVQRVTSHNPDCFWAIARRNHFDVRAPEGDGYVAFLPLTEEGLCQLLDGRLDRRDPPLGLVCSQHEKPAGVYVWHVYAPGQLAAGAALAAQKMWSLQNRNVDLYSWSINDEAARFVEGMGFRRAPKLVGSTAPQFHVFRRSDRDTKEALRASPPTQPQAGPRLTVRVARSLEDFMRAVSVRSAVYIAEQRCPYEEEFDGNDFSATHVLGCVDDEPAGCMRIRYFADFAKVERLVVRKEFRSSGLARRLVRESVELCRMKGYERVYVYAQKRLTKFWAKCGFEVPQRARDLEFSDFDYVEMVAYVTRHPEAISINTNPYVVIRPEGHWSEPGVLERSRSRGVSRPSAAQEAAA